MNGQEVKLKISAICILVEQHLLHFLYTFIQHVSTHYFYFAVLFHLRKFQQCADHIQARWYYILHTEFE